MSNTENCTMHLSYRLRKKNKHIPGAQFVARAVICKQRKKRRSKLLEQNCTVYRGKLQQRQDLNSLNFYFFNFGNM